MHDGIKTFDLGFPSVDFSVYETPWNFNVFLYEGGAAARADLVQHQVAAGKLGKPLIERLDLVRALRDEIATSLAGGGSRATAASTIRVIRRFFSFADATSLPLTHCCAIDTYLAWCDELHLRTKLKHRKRRSNDKSRMTPLKDSSAFCYAANIGDLLDSVLGLRTSAIRLSRLQAPKKRKAPVGAQADKQNLQETFAFGSFLQDICDGLSLSVVLQAPWPVRIPLRTGQELMRCRSLSNPVENSQIPRGRETLVNLRVESELLMFIGQTGMNLSQAAALELRNFFYVSHLDGYQVKEQKNRRHGAVLFEIYKDYKPHFERYLTWRRELFPQSNKLFPFLRKKNARVDAACRGSRLRALCSELGIAFVSPRMLRNTRVNWLLRQSADPDMTAEMAQHTKQTLLSVYERPSLQRAMIEVTRFWKKVDPALTRREAVAPGGCTGESQADEFIPRHAPQPDCSRQAGCLWCVNHRDIDTLDYVWALASFKYLKIVEMRKVCVPSSDASISPAKLTIHRIDEKLKWFNDSNDLRRNWVIEAQARVEESAYHPDFEVVIGDAEGT
jgi:hypothetical protein